MKLDEITRLCHMKAAKYSCATLAGSDNRVRLRNSPLPLPILQPSEDCTVSAYYYENRWQGARPIHRVSERSRKLHPAFNVGDTANIATSYHPDELQFLLVYPVIRGRSSIQF